MSGFYYLVANISEVNPFNARVVAPASTVEVNLKDLSVIFE
jgi:hypothetical protein